MSSLEYLEEERKKIWRKITELESDIRKKTTDYEKEAKQSSKMASEYRNRSEDAKNQTIINQNESQEAKQEANNTVQSIINYHENIIKIYDDIQEKQIIANEHATSIENILDSLTVNIEKFESVFVKHPDINSEMIQLESIFTQSDEFRNKISATYKSCLNRKNEIDELYYDIVGYTETEDGSAEETYIEGLKDKIEQSFDELKKQLKKYGVTITEFKDTKEGEIVSFIDKWKTEIESINKKIQGLLPRALTTGLSYAYSDKKEAEEQEIINHERKFLIAIIGLVVVSIIPFGVNVALWNNGKTLEELIINMPRMVSAILPLYLPLLWLAYVANKSLNLSKRLIEEYTHKEVLSKTFEGLSSQISEIDNEDISSELKIKLIYNILDVSSENPGKLITDYNKADHPLFDALEKSVQLANAIDKLSKIPGLGKLSSLVHQKSTIMLEKETVKAEKGLSSVLENTTESKVEDTKEQ